MKKLLGLIFLFLTTSYFLLAASSPSLAYTQVGCTVGNYVCNGTVGSSTCVINAQGTAGVWQPSAPTEAQAQAGSNCETSQQFTSASGSWFIQDPATWQQTVFGTAGAEVGAEKYGVFTITNLANTVIAATGGIQTLTYDQNGKPYYTREGGAIGLLAGLTGSLYNTPPASSIEYLADLGNNLGIIKPAYAQGIGFNAFSPLLSLWKTFRDLAYLFFVVIFVVVGLMVMFRKKIDPRTVVTIQEALPKLVLTLIIVTFSYAIIGLLIDLMQLANYVIINLLVVGSAGRAFFSPGDPKIDQFLQSNIMNLVWEFSSSVSKLGKSITTVVLPTSTFIASGLINITIEAIFTIALFFNMFKIFFMLLGSYVGIILAVILAPLQTILGAFPGNKNPLSWIKSLLADILVFPATLTMLLIAYKFTVPTTQPWDLLAGSANSNTFGWAPALIGNWSSGGGGGVAPLLGFGILMAIPAVGKAIKEALEVKEGGLAGEAEKGIRGGASYVPFVGGFLR